MEDIKKQKIEFLTTELDKIDKILSNFSEGTGIQLAIAGLLSLLPSFEITGNYLPHFLLWTFPFIIVAILLYYRASWRVSSVVKGIEFAEKGSSRGSDLLTYKVEYLEIIWKKALENHDSVIQFYSWGRSVTYAYMFSMIVNFYIFVFDGEPGVCTSLITCLASCLIAVLLYHWPKSRSEKGRAIGTTK